MVKTLGAAAVIKYKGKYIFEIQKPHKWDYDSSGRLEIGIGCLEKGVEIISTEVVPPNAQIKATGTVRVLQELYYNYKYKIEYLYWKIKHSTYDTYVVRFV